MNKTQTDRAEELAYFVNQKKLMKQFQRMDYYDKIRRQARRIIRHEKSEWKKADERMRYYTDHALRMEQMRLQFVQDSMSEGIIPDSPAIRAVELYVKPKDLKRVPNTEKVFTDRQMEMAMKSLDVKAQPLELWL